ncbi:hypothetical protein PIB30_073363 [Stylosanthes scabra]|uniref:Uncharacterized protein n=1 Tax=Stylosanthes scabra TaxID=79078 RepID=A0ABU6WP17_9FABA|nr:hypothetical protein [Stylosanthes scabra]
MPRVPKMRRIAWISVKPVWRQFLKGVITKGGPSTATTKEKVVINNSSDSEISKKVEDANMELIAMDEPFVLVEEDEEEEEQEDLEEDPDEEEEGEIEYFRKMKKGSLRSKERSLEAILSRSPTHRRGSWRLCMLHHEQTIPRHPLIKPRRGHLPCLSTHRRRSPRICVDDAVFSQTLDLGKYTESYQVIYHNEVEYRSHEG